MELEFVYVKDPENEAKCNEFGKGCPHCKTCSEVISAMNNKIKKKEFNDISKFFICNYRLNTVCPVSDLYSMIPLLGLGDVSVYEKLSAYFDKFFSKKNNFSRMICSGMHFRERILEAICIIAITIGKTNSVVTNVVKHYFGKDETFDCELLELVIMLSYFYYDDSKLNAESLLGNLSHSIFGETNVKVVGRAYKPTCSVLERVRFRRYFLNIRNIMIRKSFSECKKLIPLLNLSREDPIINFLMACIQYYEGNYFASLNLLEKIAKTEDLDHHYLLYESIQNNKALIYVELRQPHQAFQVMQKIYEKTENSKFSYKLLASGGLLWATFCYNLGLLAIACGFQQYAELCLSKFGTIFGDSTVYFFASLTNHILSEYQMRKNATKKYVKRNANIDFLCYVASWFSSTKYGSGNRILKENRFTLHKAALVINSQILKNPNKYAFNNKEEYHLLYCYTFLKDSDWKNVIALADHSCSKFPTSFMLIYLTKLWKAHSLTMLREFKRALDTVRSMNILKEIPFNLSQQSMLLGLLDKQPYPLPKTLSECICVLKYNKIIIQKILNYETDYTRKILYLKMSDSTGIIPQRAMKHLQNYAD